MTVAFLDACVLYPDLVRALLLGAAEAGLILPRLSPRVAAEWRIVAARERGPEGEAAMEAVLDAIKARWPGLKVAPDPALEATLELPDPADAHVLAGAVAAGAGWLVTFNLRDFPARRLARFGIEARHPDSVLWELSSVAPAVMAPVVRDVLGRFCISPERQRATLKRARLPRLGKHWANTASG